MINLKKKKKDIFVGAKYKNQNSGTNFKTKQLLEFKKKINSMNFDRYISNSLFIKIRNKKLLKPRKKGRKNPIQQKPGKPANHNRVTRDYKQHSWRLLKVFSFLLSIINNQKSHHLKSQGLMRKNVIATINFIIIRKSQLIPRLLNGDRSR